MSLLLHLESMDAFIVVDDVAALALNRAVIRPFGRDNPTWLKFKFIAPGTLQILTRSLPLPPLTCSLVCPLACILPFSVPLSHIVLSFHTL